MQKRNFTLCAQRGFTLVEALVALVVTAFGMLALAGFQASLSVASDNAKQRSEAVRLAQQTIDTLRGFEQIDADAALFDYAADVVSGGPETLSKTSADAYTTANAYQRQWWATRADGVTPSQPGDLQKWLRVSVTWTDRRSQQQEVTLRSVIVRAEPADLGTLATGPGVQKLRTPKNRHADIPYPAKKLAGGKSAFRPPGASVDYVFDNRTGDVLGYCSQSLNEGDSVSLDSSGTVTSGCTVRKSYLLSGYIRFLDNLPSGNEDQVDQAISNPVDTTHALTGSIVFSSPMPAGHPAADCYTERQKVVSTNNASSVSISAIVRSSLGTVTVTTAQNHGIGVGQMVTITNTNDQSFIGQFVVTATTNNTLTYVQAGAAVSSSGGTASLIQQLTIAESAPTPSGYNRELSRFVSYACFVETWDHDGDEQTSTQNPTRRVWWGQFAITPVGSWTLGTGNGNRKVCRFSGDYVIDDKISNTEHPLYYRGVSGALDAQDYLVIRGNDTCPNDSKVAPLTGDYINTHTLLHQTAAGSAAAGAPSSTNAQWATTPEPNSAPSAVTDTLPMF